MYRHLTRRKLLCVLLPAIGAVGLAACGGSTPATTTGATSALSTGTSSSAAGSATSARSATSTASAATQAAASASEAGGGTTTTLQFIGWDDQATLNLVKQFYATEFTPSHPAIKVNVISTAGGNFNDKITAMLASGTPPDMMYVQDYMASSWVAKNALTDLSPYANADKSGTVQQNWPNAIGFFQIGGKLFGLPKDFSSMVIYYNKELFAAANVKAPGNDGWTWDDFLQASHQLTRQGTNGQQWGFNLRTGTDSGFGPWMWQNGGDFYADPHNPTPSTFTFDQAPAADAIQWYVDLIFKEHVAPTPDQLKNQGDLFAKGQIGMMQNWTSAMVGLRTTIKSFSWDVVPMPKQKSAAIPLTVVALGIPGGSKHSDDAWQAIAFYNGISGSQFTLKSGWGIPPNEPIARSAAFLQDTPPANKQVFLDQIQYARLWPQSAAWPDQRSVILKALGPVFSGQQRARDAIAAARQQVLSTA